MKVVIPELQNLSLAHGAEQNDFLKTVLNKHIAEIDKELVQDLSHISHFATYPGGMTVEKVVFQKDNLYRMDYSYPWEMNWSCADQVDEGLIHDKVRFTVSGTGEIHFKLLVLAS
ncbi:hypothetical protein GHNINEIG_00980 [Hydrogenovibrio crunogenus]|uniref:Uncharacterized protein n=1 Tax=Hydrogenovibrio crunogenus TaxID=39765 RepID=A0A4P7NZB1_9GAMM|nr:hypothetical protein [Hydrogenovibrio crunogenus]QBZ82939.1 hypothetical protein GHNINEIG_00980 [Hydrogenovibrio crunogenus]